MSFLPGVFLRELFLSRTDTTLCTSSLSDFVECDIVVIGTLVSLSRVWHSVVTD